MERAELAEYLGVTPARQPRREPSVIATVDPRRFQAEFAAAVAAGGPVFLADPAWGETERTAFASLVARPDEGPDDGSGWLAVPTGGTSGRLKLARHDAATLAAAVQGLRGGLSIQKVDAVSLLAPHQVGGLMAWLRAVLTGGNYRPATWARVAAGERPAPGGFLSLVPTQLARLLDDAGAVAWLREFDGLFVGGGPMWPALIEASAAAGLPLAPAYGATETAAMITVLPPADFLAGGRGCGPALPHGRVSLSETGLIEVTGASLFRGYWPERRAEHESWLSGDRGGFDDRGSLHVLGRADAVIVTGGKKVDPWEVETMLRDGAEGRDLAVLGLPDPDWGEVVALAYDGAGGEWAQADIARLLTGKLARHKHPKVVRAIAPWPRTAAGKLDRGALRRLWSEG
jgi:O-succinylbenzoic acid--CoA ligase